MSTPMSLLMDLNDDELETLRDVDAERIRQSDPDQGLEVGVMPNATMQGRPGVVIAARLDNGDAVVLQTTLALFLSAADAFRARYGDSRI